MKKSSLEANKKYYIYPLIFTVLVIPLIVHLNILSITDNGVLKVWDNSKDTDFFSFYKMIFIVINAIISAVFLIFKKTHKNSMKNRRYNIATIIFCIFVMLSAIFSGNKYLSFYGAPDRYENLFVLISYMILFISAVNFVNDEEDIKKIIKYLTITALIIAVIGMFQFLKLDILNTNFGKELILFPNYSLIKDTIKLAFEPGTVYATLFHYNYVGSYAAMLFPLSLMLFMYSKEKGRKILFGVITLLMFVLLIICRSRAGMVGAALSFIVFLIIRFKKILHNWKVVISITGILIIAFIGIDYISKGFITNRFKSKNSITDIKKSISAGIDDVKIDKNRITIKEYDKILYIVYSNNMIFVNDENDKEMGCKINGSEFTIGDKRYSDYKFLIGKSNNMSVLQMTKKNVTLNFAIRPDGFKLINNRGEMVDINPVEKFGFEGKETIGSARGYIWSRTLPLLKKTILVGHGPDTFLINFPQGDYIGKLKAYGTINMLVDKPHNFYLQTAVNTGVISLLALLYIFISYIISSIKIYKNNKLDNSYSIYGIGIFMAVIGYLGAAIFNDSVVSVAPVFWILLGTGVSINMKLKNGQALVDTKKIKGSR